MDKKLCLLWQDVYSKRWYHIGNLKFTNEFYEFAYENSESRFSLLAALESGYRLHPSFPKRDEVYKSKKLFNCFSRKLPNFKRKEVQSKYAPLSLTINSSEYEILALIGGRFIGDSYEFMKPVEFKGNDFEFNFYVRGTRHYSLSDFLKINSLLLRKKIDGHIIRVFEKTNEGENDIGYMPSLFADLCSHIIENKDKVEVIDYKFYEKLPSELQIQVAIKGTVNLSIDYQDYKSVCDFHFS